MSFSHQSLDLEDRPVSSYIVSPLSPGSPSITAAAHAPASMTVDESHEHAWRRQSRSQTLIAPLSSLSSTPSEPDESIYQQPDQPISDRELLVHLKHKVSGINPHMVSLKRNLKTLTENVEAQSESLRVLRLLHSITQTDESHDHLRPSSHDLDELFEIWPAMLQHADMLREKLETLDEEIAELEHHAVKHDIAEHEQYGALSDQLGKISKQQVEDQELVMEMFKNLFDFNTQKLPAELLDMRKELQEALVAHGESFGKMLENMDENHSLRHINSLAKLHHVQHEQGKQHEVLVERLDNVDEVQQMLVKIALVIRDEQGRQHEFNTKNFDSIINLLMDNSKFERVYSGMEVLRQAQEKMCQAQMEQQYQQSFILEDTHHIFHILQAQSEMFETHLQKVHDTQVEQQETIFRNLEDIDLKQSAQREHALETINNVFAAEFAYQGLQEKIVADKLEHIEFVQMQQENTIMAKLNEIQNQQLKKMDQIGQAGILMCDILKDCVIDKLDALESKIDDMSSASAWASEKPEVSAVYSGGGQVGGSPGGNPGGPSDGVEVADPENAEEKDGGLLEALWSPLWPVVVMVLLVLWVGVCEGYGN